MDRRRTPRFRWARVARLLISRIALPLALLIAVFVIGTVGYYTLGIVHARGWSILDCAFMTSITLSTVGYGDPIGASAFAEGRIYTMFLIVSGLGVTLYSVSTLTAFVVEGHLGRVFLEERMQQRIERLTRHTIICGTGRTGLTVVEEHLEENRPFVAIDREAPALEHVTQMAPEACTIHGDATDEAILERAGIDRAHAIVAALDNDRANMFLVVTARFRRKDLRIIVKCVDHDVASKFIAAGANHVVSPAHIGGRRIASFVLRPAVLEFLDSIQRRSDAGVGAEEILIEKGSELDGRTIEAAQESGLPIVAVRRAGERHFIYAPHGTDRLDAGTSVVVIGPPERVKKLEARAQTR